MSRIFRGDGAIPPAERPAEAAAIRQTSPGARSAIGKSFLIFLMIFSFPEAFFFCGRGRRFCQCVDTLACKTPFGAVVDVACLLARLYHRMPA